MTLIHDEFIRSNFRSFAHVNGVAASGRPPSDKCRGAWRAVLGRRGAGDYSRPATILIGSRPFILMMRRRRRDSAAHLVSAEAVQVGTGPVGCEWELGPVGCEMTWDNMVRESGTMKGTWNWDRDRWNWYWIGIGIILGLVLDWD